jgi:hypothetical protein
MALGSTPYKYIVNKAIYLDEYIMNTAIYLARDEFM